MQKYPDTSHPIRFGDEEMLLDACGSLFWPTKNLLVISDLHLEKASFLAQFGTSLPLYDSRDTLQRLEAVIERYQPAHVLCLGDSFHDRQGFARLPHAETELLTGLIRSRHSWTWILGNHDPLPETMPEGRFRQEERYGAVHFSHDKIPGSHLQVIGHYHPKLSLKKAGQRVKGRCFLVGHQLLVMPAFGSYTGGLDADSTVITALFSTPYERYLIYRERLWKL